MARKKLSRIEAFDIAKSRLAAIKSIDPNLDLGNGITAIAYEKLLNDFGTDLGNYNTALSTVDDLYNKCNEGLLGIRDYSERVLAGVASKYGKNSSQYEMAGGVKKSERKKPTSKKANG